MDAAVKMPRVSDRAFKLSCMVMFPQYGKECVVQLVDDVLRGLTPFTGADTGHIFGFFNVSLHWFV
jgi:hypothetical protein